MKYLLGYLEAIPDAPNLSDPQFQQLLVDVQAGKSQAKSSEAFNENLEKILNELKSTPEAQAFLKPVSKREAPNYYEIIAKPMDLSTMLRNVKSGRYKTKADFVADLDLIWANCLFYNAQETHHLRAAARLMKQKADHHLTFLAEKNDRSANNVLKHLPARHTSIVASAPTRPNSDIVKGARPITHSTSAPNDRNGHADGNVNGNGIGEEDAAGESDDGAGESEQVPDFRDGAKMGEDKLESEKNRLPESRAGRSTSRDQNVVVNGHRCNGQASGSRQSPPPFRPKLQTTFDTTPIMTRTPHSMIHYQSLSLQDPSPSFADKGKARDMLYSHQAPSWFHPTPTDLATRTDDVKFEGQWWGFIGKDEAYTTGLPIVPAMVTASGSRPKVRGLSRKRRKITPGSDSANNHGTCITDSSATLVDEPLSMVLPKAASQTTPTSTRALRSKPINLKTKIHRNVDTLFSIRKTVNQIQDWQKAENEGLPLPITRPHIEKEERRLEQQLRSERKRRMAEEKVEMKKRIKMGGEVGDEEAALSVRSATASMLAQAGFDGADQTPMDLLSRMVVERLTNLGKTFRLLVDGFSNKMSEEEIVLHALYENGQLGPGDIEAHVKDDIEKEQVKLADMDRKMKQAYKDIATAPIIEDDMMFADNGEMLLDGNFADELGEDFLGLRDLGIAREHGMDSLSVPTSIFYGRKKRHEQIQGTRKEGPDYPPPRTFEALQPSTWQNQLPSIFHSFFNARMENGTGLGDDLFDHTHSQIGSLGQIVIKAPPVQKKKVEVEKKKKPPKVVVPGPGKGNWIRPSKEERERRAAEKKAFIAMRANGMANSNTNGNGSINGSIGGNTNGGSVSGAGTVGSEEDADGEEE